MRILLHTISIYSRITFLGYLNFSSLDPQLSNIFLTFFRLLRPI